MFLSLVLAALAVASPTTPALDEYLANAVRNDDFSGSVLITRDGQTLLSKGYGMANLELDVPNTPQTVFSLGTTTQRFTAVATMMLRDRGLLDLDAPVCKYLKDCPQSWAPIHVRHLLARSSGIPEYFPSADSEDWMGARTTPVAMLKRIGMPPLQFVPGSQFNATNSGHFVLGAILERVSGKSYAELIRESIFVPLGMTRSGFDDASIVKNRASGYSVMDDGRVVNAMHIDPSFAFSTAGVHSTTEDLLRWENALRAGSVLPAKSLAEWEILETSAGYGERTPELFGRAVTLRWGSTYGFRNHFAYFPKDDLTIIILTNRGSGKGDRYVRDLAAIALGESVPSQTFKEITVDPETLRAFTGRYQFAPDRLIDIALENGQLTMKATNRPKRELAAADDGTFRIRGGEAYLTFEKDAQGKVIRLLLHEIKSTIPAMRVE